MPIRKIMTCIEVADILNDMPSLTAQEAFIRTLGDLRVRVELRPTKIRISYMSGQRLIEIHRERDN